MLIPEDERTKLHDADESRQEVDFRIRVPAVNDA